MASSIEQMASGITFDTFKKAHDLKKRILFTLGVLIIYRLGTYIPLPGINPLVIKDFIQSNAGGILGIVDMFSGGSLGRMTIFALNIMPYISASIIIQLMTAISPQLEALKKEGDSGRKKITQYTRYLTVLLCIFQSYGISVGLESISAPSGMAVMDPGMLFKITTVITFTGGTLFIMWLGEQITSRGIGNGISLIIYAGIVANLPQSALSFIRLGREGAIAPLIIISVILLVIFVIAYVVFMERAQRRITIQYPKRQMSANMPAVSQTTHLPMKLNVSGVIPPIFASSLLLLPATLTGFAGSTDQTGIAATIARLFSHGHPVYIITFTVLIIFFAFFYTAITFNPEETAENLRKQGNFIPGVRPGKPTSDFLDYVLTRITVVGALYLASVCIIPELILSRVSLPFYFGGTSILIVVSVTMDTITQVQSHLFAHQYEGLMKKAKARGKGRF